MVPLPLPLPMSIFQKMGLSGSQVASNVVATLLPQCPVDHLDRTVLGFIFLYRKQKRMTAAQF